MGFSFKDKEKEVPAKRQEVKPVQSVTPVIMTAIVEASSKQLRII